MNVKWYLSDNFACGYVRGEVPARVVNETFGDCRIDCKGDIYISDYYKTDIMLFQRQHSVDILKKMLFAKSRGIKTIYELDDDLFNTPKDFIKPYKFYSNPQIRDTVKTFLKEADAVTVSTETLANAIKKYTKKPIFIVENYLDNDRWVSAYAQKQTQMSEAVTIGWMASGSHAIDMPLVEDALHRIMTEYKHVKLHLIGWVGWKELGERFESMKDRITCEDWVDINELPFAMADFDIGIAPLITDKFNKSKSAIKIMQYWALGIPCIASNLKEYRSKIDKEVNGFLAKNEEEWYSYMKLLIDDDGKRKLMGAHGRKKLLLKYDIKNNARQWVNVFSALLSDRR